MEIFNKFIGFVTFAAIFIDFFFFKFSNAKKNSQKRSNGSSHSNHPVYLLINSFFFYFIYRHNQFSQPHFGKFNPVIFEIHL